MHKHPEVLVYMVLVLFYGVGIENFAVAHTGNPLARETMITGDGKQLFKPYYINDGVWEQFIKIAIGLYIEIVAPMATFHMDVTVGDPPAKAE